MSSPSIKFISYDMIPTDTGVTANFVLEVAVKNKAIVFNANEFIPDNKICGSSAYLVDSYERIRTVVLGIAEALESAA